MSTELLKVVDICMPFQMLWARKLSLHQSHD
jgi:hypothetical protein